MPDQASGLIARLRDCLRPPGRLPSVFRISNGSEALVGRIGAKEYLGAAFPGPHVSSPCNRAGRWPDSPRLPDQICASAPTAFVACPS
jgi:hypothetical protein